MRGGTSLETRKGVGLEYGDHAEDRRGYLGAAHAECNARAAAIKTNQLKARKRGEPYDPPMRWSRMWHDNPPPGAVVRHEDGPWTWH